MAENTFDWQRIRNLITHFSQMNCFDEEIVHFEETVEKYGFADFLLDGDEGGTTFDDTFEGNTFDEVTTYDDTLLSSLIDRINISIGYIQRKNTNNKYQNKGYDYTNTNFDVDFDNNFDDQDHDDHLNNGFIFYDNTVDDMHLSSLLEASTVSYKAASDNLDNDNDNDNDNNHVDNYHDHDDIKKDDKEEKNIFTQDRKHHKRTPSPLKPMSLELELGLKNDNDIPQSLIVIPTAISTRHNHPMDEDDDTRGFFDDDSFSLLTTDIELMTVSPSMSPSSPFNRKRTTYK